MRWIWLQKTEPNRPWAKLPIQVPNHVRSFFLVAIISEVGNGSHTLFWTDRWLHGQCIADLAPRLYATVPKRRIKKCIVQEALTDRTWVKDIQGALTVGAIVDFLQLWDLLSGFELHPEVEDPHIWRLSCSGQYSAKSAYESLFIGAIQFWPWERIWKTWAPAKYRFFLWLVAHNRCWTADRLAKMEYLNLSNARYVTKKKKISITSSLPVSSLDNFGIYFLDKLGFTLLLLNPRINSLTLGGRESMKQLVVWSSVGSTL